MKNLVFNLAIVLVVIAYVGGVSFELKKEVKTSGNNQKIALPLTSPVLAEEKFAVGAVSKHNEGLQNKVGIPSVRIERVTIGTSKTDFPETLFPDNAPKTIDEIIAEDNAITGNDSSIENGMSAVNANLSIDNITFKEGKTIDEIITEDNAITGNDSSNENGMSAANANLSIDNITFKEGKTIDEIIAEDNAITGNDYSSEVPAENLVTENTLNTINIDNVVFNKAGKTIEEIIAEDDAITENNRPNETATLDFK